MSPIHAPSQPFIQHLSQHDSGLPPPSLSLRTPPRAECPPPPPPGQTSTKVPRWAELGTSSVPFTRHQRSAVSSPTAPVTAPPEAQPTLASAFLLQL